MSRRRLLILSGAICIATLGFFGGYRFMTDYAQNDYCRLLDEAEYLELESILADEVMPEKPDGIIVQLVIDTDLPKDGGEVLSISLGSLSDPNAVEYKGPLRDTVEMRVALAPDEDSFPVFPSVQILNRTRKAVCVWEAEQGFDVVRGDDVVKRRLVLLARRKAGQMGSLDVVDDDA